MPSIATSAAATSEGPDAADASFFEMAPSAPVNSPCGDWNACTIDDPKRSLAACKSLVNPGAKGARGQAAAQLADGLSLAWQGNIDRAITAFDQAIAIDPKSSLAYLNRGLALRRLGEEDRALADLDRAVKLAPTARSYYHRSLLQREKGNERRARADESRAVELDSDYEAVIGR